jgi:hypothetical protein
MSKNSRERRQLAAQAHNDQRAKDKSLAADKAAHPEKYQRRPTRASKKALAHLAVYGAFTASTLHKYRAFI